MSINANPSGAVPARQPKGTPTGGRFAESAKSEAALDSLVDEFDQRAAEAEMADIANAAFSVRERIARTNGIESLEFTDDVVADLYEFSEDDTLVSQALDRTRADFETGRTDHESTEALVGHLYDAGLAARDERFAREAAASVSVRG